MLCVVAIGLFYNNPFDPIASDRTSAKAVRVKTPSQDVLAPQHSEDHTVGFESKKVRWVNNPKRDPFKLEVRALQSQTTLTKSKVLKRPKAKGYLLLPFA